MNKLGVETVEVWPTLMSCYRPVEKYIELFAQATGVEYQPVAPLSALDAYLLHLVASGEPREPAVVDLAAAATQGASTAFWVAAGMARKVIAPRLAEMTAGEPWRAHFDVIAEELLWEVTAGSLDATLALASEQGAADWARLCQEFPPLAPVFITLALPEAEAPQLTGQLQRLLAWQPQAKIFLWPVEEIGQSALLFEALKFCADNSAYRFTLLRELSPFFAQSRLSVITTADDAAFAQTCARLRQWYEGNFQFLTLTKELARLATGQPTVAARVVYMPPKEPPQFQQWFYETKRWLWHRVLPDWSKNTLNVLRGRSRSSKRRSKQ